MPDKPPKKYLTTEQALTHIQTKYANLQIRMAEAEAAATFAYQNGLATGRHQAHTELLAILRSALTTASGDGHPTASTRQKILATLYAKVSNKINDERRDRDDREVG